MRKPARASTLNRLRERSVMLPHPRRRRHLAKRALGLVAVALCCFGPRLANASEKSTRLSSRGLVEFHADHYREALKLFDEAVAADEGDIYARYYRAVTRGRLDDLKGAISDLRAVLAAKPDLDQAALEIGVALVQTNQYAEATKWLQQAQRAKDEDAKASLFLGIAQLRLQQLDSARANFERAAAKDPKESLAAKYYLGVVDYQQGRWTDARQQFTAVAEGSPATEMGREAAKFLDRMSKGPTAGRRYQLYASAAFQYDSNVVLAPSNEVIKEAAGISSQADGRFALAFGGTYVLWRTDRVALALGYDFFKSMHFNLKEFNLNDHGPNVQLTAKTDFAQVGILGRYDYYLLQSQSFLQEVTVLPWMTIPEGPWGRTDVYYRMRRRDFKTLAFISRDAFNHAAGFKQYGYVGSPDKFLSIGYQFDREDPVVSERSPTSDHDANQFAYDGNEVNVGLGWAFPEKVTAETGYAYRHERYAAPSNGRRDEEHDVYFLARRPLTEYLSLTAGYFGTINNSNDLRFDYERHVGSVGLEVRY
jgi:tetratricopeptide (TPR) repeat protein